MQSLYLGNVSYDAIEEDLKRLFSDAGFNPTQLRLILDRETGQSRGFAFADFETKDEAERAAEMLNDEYVRGRPLRIRLAEPKPPRKDGQQRW